MARLAEVSERRILKRFIAFVILTVLILASMGKGANALGQPSFALNQPDANLKFLNAVIDFQNQKIEEQRKAAQAIIDAENARKAAEAAALVEQALAAKKLQEPIKLQPAAPATVEGCGDNEYAHFIYMHESGCNLNAVNAGGCRGIGQACPGSKLPCGADYACQNTWFSNYAISAYGSWEAAYSFWLSHSWW